MSRTCWPRLFPLGKRSLPFLTVDAIIGNQAFSHGSGLGLGLGLGLGFRVRVRVRVRVKVKVTYNRDISYKRQLIIVYT